MEPIYTLEEITINVINDDEPATIAATVNASSFAENQLLELLSHRLMQMILRAVQ
jgi:hypothetical protein